MTEEEAKTKWCPFAVASHTNPRGKTEYDSDGTRLPAPTFQHACLGSACMAWRSSGERRFWKSDNAPVKDGQFISDAEQRVEHHGYCGLAGQP